MAATAPDLTRRTLLFAVCAAALHADDAQDVWDLLTEVASALSEGNPSTFLSAFDQSMPDYGMLQANVNALLDQCQVQSSIELLKGEGNASTRNVELDWFLQIVEQQDAATVTRRREVVHCRLIKEKKKWRITSLEPIALFAPPGPSRTTPQ